MGGDHPVKQKEPVVKQALLFFYGRAERLNQMTNRKENKMKVPNGIKNVENWIAPAVIDQNGKLHLGRFVGTVNRVWYFVDPDCGYGEDCHTGLAYQTINGRIIAVDPAFEPGKPGHVNSLKGVDRVEILWGIYPKGFPEGWKAVEC